MYKAIAPAQSWNLAYGYVIKAILFIYIPGKWTPTLLATLLPIRSSSNLGSYVLYTHMMAQRRKVLRAQAS